MTHRLSRRVSNVEIATEPKAVIHVVERWASEPKEVALARYTAKTGKMPGKGDMVVMVIRFCEDNIPAIERHHAASK